MTGLNSSSSIFPHKAILETLRSTQLCSDNFCPVLSTLLTIAVLRCRVSWSTEPVSQFLILTNRGHLEGLPFTVFLVGDCRPDGGGWTTVKTRHEVSIHRQDMGKRPQQAAASCISGCLCLDPSDDIVRKRYMNQTLTAFGILQWSNQPSMQLRSHLCLQNSQICRRGVKKQRQKWLRVKLCSRFPGEDLPL